MIVNNAWYGVCKDLVTDFSLLVERCNKTPIRRKNVQKLIEYLDERKNERVSRIDEGDGTKAERNQEAVIEVSLN